MAALEAGNTRSLTRTGLLRRSCGGLPAYPFQIAHDLHHDQLPQIDNSNAARWSGVVFLDVDDDIGELRLETIRQRAIGIEAGNARDEQEIAEPRRRTAAASCSSMPT